MSNIRASRLQEEIRSDIADILRNRLTDPRLAWVSVVRVEMSRDLSHARVFVSFLGTEEVQESSLRVLHHATPAVRAELAHRLRLRRVPEIEFQADRSIEYSARVQSILKELGLSGDSAPGGQSPEDDS